MAKEIYQRALEQSMSYPEYRQLIDHQLAAGKTTGADHSPAMLYYTELNVKRMQKWEKRFIPDPAVLEAMRSVKGEIWLVITEGWCGDAAHNLPVMDHLVKEATGIELRLVLRDKHPELMDRHLTEGGRSIPKLIRLKKSTLDVIGSWGPRPAEAQKMFKEMKAAGIAHDEYTRAIQLWYARDRGQSLQRELAAMVG